jgi:PBP1b-binding outer membrane lipoprotein LpoB
MRAAVLVLAALALGGCESKRLPTESKSAQPATPTAQATITDLSTSLAAARSEFNAHKGEARFLTLLSPT